MKEHTRFIQLSDELATRLSRTVEGEGGFQRLVRDIQTRMSDRVLELDDTLRERIEHYAYDFGSGGWQTLLRDLLAEIERKGDSGDGPHGSAVEAP